MRTTKLMAGALTLLVLVGGAAAAETVQSSEGTVFYTKQVFNKYL